MTTEKNSTQLLEKPSPRLKVFAWNPYRFHCYGEPDGGDGKGGIYVADLFPGWMIPGLWLHEWVELHSGSHRMGLLAEVLLYNILWPFYHWHYLRILHDYPLSSEITD